MTDDARRNDPTRVLARRTLAWLLDVVLFEATFLAAIVVFGQRFTGAAIAAEPAGFRFESGDATLWFPKDVPGLGDSVLVVPGDKFWLAVALFWVALLIDWVLVQGLTGATFGKGICRLRCVTRERPKPGIGRAFVRTLLWVIDIITIVLPIGFILATFTKGHRRVGDFAGATFVVDRKFAARLGGRRRGRDDAERVPADEVALTGVDDGTGEYGGYGDDEQYAPVPAGDEPPSVFEPGATPTAAAATAAAASTPDSGSGGGAPERSTEPVWNDALETYVRWEPSVDRWIGWDEEAQKWRLVDPSRLQ